MISRSLQNRGTPENRICRVVTLISLVNRPNTNGLLLSNHGHLLF